MESVSKTRSSEYTERARKVMRVFDSGEDFTDRFTVFPFPDSPDPSLRGQFLGCSLGGRAVSMWGECHPDALEDAAHLGVEVTLDELDEATRSHILARIEPVLTT